MGGEKCVLLPHFATKDLETAKVNLRPRKYFRKSARIRTESSLSNCSYALITSFGGYVLRNASLGDDVIL